MSGGHLLSADRSGTEMLELRAPDGALSTKKDILSGCPFLLNRSDRRRKVSSGHLLYADRSGTETLELRAPDGALSTKKRHPFRISLFVEQKR